ncbi:MAG: DUF4154 domain-containing protein [Deltaproteobacteria bacterium]|nr:DUF4154 domain-containing protein [Deltaproteobacteria bacterium]
MSRWPFFVSLLWVPVAATAAEVPVDRQAMLIARVLSYDANQPARVADGLKALVLHDASDPSSLTLARDISKVLESTTVSGVAIVARSASYSSASALESLVGRDTFDFIYVCDGLEGAIPSIVSVANKLRVPTFAGRSKYVELGVAVGIVPDAKKSRLVVHLAQAKSQGMMLSASVLGLAKVIR